jgi:hypothetical protein
MICNISNVSVEWGKEFNWEKCVTSPGSPILIAACEPSDTSVRPYRLSRRSFLVKWHFRICFGYPKSYEKK